MKTLEQAGKRTGLGDAAVEGLLNGILAGVGMAVVLVGIEALAGVDPLTVLGYFDAGANASPLVGLVTHVAVSAIYGAAFGILTLWLVRRFGRAPGLGVWLGLGLLYGFMLFALAELVILPRSHSPLSELPLWSMGAAHLVYGLMLGWLMSRTARE